MGRGRGRELGPLREVKSRDELADGLEIIIKDRRGERTYFDLSGGQRFHVDLAYRVAITRRQTQRSGAGGIGCFWLDEGIGTQDSASIESIVFALRELQHEIPQLLITTHIEAMKDCFDTRIEVDGGPMESHVKVIGR